MSAPAVSMQSHGRSPRAKQYSKKYMSNVIWGRVFVNATSVKYIGMINVGEMCFIPMNVHNELHLSPVVSTFCTSYQALSSFFIKHCILPPLPLSLSVPLSLFSFCGTPSRFPISGISLRCRDVDVFFLQSKVICS